MIRSDSQRQTVWWRTVTVKMMAGTAVLLLPTMLLSIGFSIRQHMQLEERQVEEDIAHVVERVDQSFEIITPGEETIHRSHIEAVVGNLELVRNVRIIAVNGRTAFSRDESEVGQLIDPTATEPCAGCHAVSGPLSLSATFELPDGTPVFHQTSTILNRPACLSCHQERFEELGKLLVSFDMSDVQAEMSQYRTSAVGTITLAVAAVMGGIALLFFWLIRRPLHQIQSQMKQVEAGNFALGPAVTSNDELGELYGTFERMTRQLEENRSSLQQRVSEGSEKVSALTKKLRTIDADLVRLERLSALGALSAQVVHEVRTPLNALSLNLQLLQRVLRDHDDMAPDVLELTATFKSEVDRINDVLNRFMDRARVPTVRPTLESIPKLVRNVLVLLASDAEDRGVQLEMSIPDDIPQLVVPADSLRQIMINLVSNAIRACTQGGHVQVQSRLDAETLVIEVEDTGMGIPPENLERIFDPFFTTKQDGTGLGLAIVRQIVERVGGKVSVRSEQTVGTCFTVEMPANQTLEAQDGEGHG